jgi:SAM-dependent methyltransferase
MTAPAWTAGYVSDIAYTLGFYREMAPPALDYALASNGFEGVGTGPLAYCELGCGRGYGTALLAAANPDSRFVGIDFNPAHIQEAQRLAERAGLDNIRFVEASFGDALRSESDSFDIVALHGVYSWVSPEVRGDITAFLRQKLRAGGIAYVSYNTYPGWAPTAPLQRLLREFGDRVSGDSYRRVEAGRAALAQLAASGNGYIAQTPAAKARVESLGQHAPAYVAHEFLNGNWNPFYVTEVIAAMSEAKLNYAGSASIAENRPILTIPADLAQLVQSAPDQPMRELLTDFAVNKQFRRDLYVKGGNRLQGRALAQRHAGLTLALLEPRDPVPESWPIPAGSARIKPGAVEAILARLQSGPATLEAVRAAVAAAGGEAQDVPTVVDILIHNGLVQPCRPDFATLDRGPAQRLNAEISALAKADDTHRFLAAPVLGSALGCAYFDRLALPLTATHEGSDAALIAALDELLATSGKHLQQDGKPIADKAEIASRLGAMLRQHRDATLPRLRALGAVG